MLGFVGPWSPKGCPQLLPGQPRFVAYMKGEHACVLHQDKLCGHMQSYSALGVRVLNLLWHNYSSFVYGLWLVSFSFFSHNSISNHHWDFSRLSGYCIPFCLHDRKHVFSWDALNKMFCTHYILQEASMPRVVSSEEFWIENIGKRINLDPLFQKLNWRFVYIIQSWIKRLFLIIKSLII